MSGFTFPITFPLTWTAPRPAGFWLGQDRKIHARFYVSRPDGVTWQDMTSYLVSARISLGSIAELGTGNSGVDAVVRHATFTLANDRPTVNSLHPLDRTSSWNLVGGVYAPLLWPNREVILDVAAVPIGVTPSDADWVRMFHGYLGDSISGSSDSGRIELECRDLAKRLQDCYIETVREYGSAAGTPAETVIQQIINDNITVSPPTLYCPVSPGFMIKPYKCEYQSVWDAIQQVAAQIGWFLGYKWIPDYNDFRLAFLAPPRGKDAASADWDLTGAKVIVQQLDISDRDVRNAIVVTYRDSSTGTRQSVTAQDATSIAAFGRRAMQIEEGDASLIDTSAEATALAQAALYDLKDLTATTRLTLPFLPTMDVFDAVLVTNARLSSTQDFYGVETVEHFLDFDGGKFRTEVGASGRVVGGHTRWLAMETRPGSPAYWRTEIIEEYTWQDDFLRAPFDPGLWIVATQGVGASLESTTDGTHALAISAESRPLDRPAAPSLSTQAQGGALSNGTYYVRITALNANGETAASDPASITLSAGTTTQTIRAEWAPVQGASSYGVYIGLSPLQGSIFRQAETAALTYTQVTGLVDYYGTIPSSDSTGEAIVDLLGSIAAARSMGITRHTIRFRAKFSQPQAYQDAWVGWESPYWIDELLGYVSAKGEFRTTLGRGQAYVSGIPIPYDEFAVYRIEIEANAAKLYINDSLVAELHDYLPVDGARIVAKVRLRNAKADTTYRMWLDWLQYEIG